MSSMLTGVGLRRRGFDKGLTLLQALPLQLASLALSWEPYLQTRVP